MQPSPNLNPHPHPNINPNPNPHPRRDPRPHPHRLAPSPFSTLILTSHPRPHLSPSPPPLTLTLTSHPHPHLSPSSSTSQGTISRREFAKAMATLGLGASTEEMDDIFATFDPDGSGTIEYAELQSALMPRRNRGHTQG